MDFLKGRKGRKKDKDTDRNDSISSPSLDSMGSPVEESIAENAPLKSTRTRVGGWAADDTPSSSAKTRHPTNIIEQERFLGNKGTSSSTPDDIPTIPDLDDFQEEQINELAPRHSMSVQMAATYTVLDKDSKMGSYGVLDDLDLSLLGKCLELGDTTEPDEEWNWDTLFAQISSEVVTRNGTPAGGSGEPGNGAIVT